MGVKKAGRIHRESSMNKPISTLDARKAKKFKQRQKLKALKKHGPEALIKTPRVDPEDEGIIPPVMVKNITRHNPLANIKLSKKRRNKLLKRKRYDEKARKEAEEKAIQDENACQLKSLVNKISTKKRSKILQRKRYAQKRKAELARLKQVEEEEAALKAAQEAEKEAVAKKAAKRAAKRAEFLARVKDARKARKEARKKNAETVEKDGLKYTHGPWSLDPVQKTGTAEDSKEDDEKELLEDPDTAMDEVCEDELELEKPDTVEDSFIEDQLVLENPDAEEVSLFEDQLDLEGPDSEGDTLSAEDSLFEETLCEMPTPDEAFSLSDEEDCRELAH